MIEFKNSKQKSQPVLHKGWIGKLISGFYKKNQPSMSKNINKMNRILFVLYFKKMKEIKN